VHDELRKRTKKRNESYGEYCYKMKNIAAKMKLDEEIIIEYIIKDRNDDRWDKNYLNDTKSIRELKTKLKRYENIKTDTHRRTNDKQTSKRCYNCGDANYLSIPFSLTVQCNHASSATTMVMWRQNVQPKEEI